MTELSSNEENKGVESQEISQPGTILKKVREEKNLSVKQIGLALNLPERFIDYLEKGSFDMLPGHTFARGYIRNYAKYMDMENAEDLVKMFDAVTGTNGLGSSVSNLQQIKQIKHFSNSIYWLISFIAVLVIIGVVFVWWQSRFMTIEPIDNTPVVVESTPDPIIHMDSNATELTIPVNTEHTDISQTEQLPISNDTDEYTEGTDNQEASAESVATEQEVATTPSDTVIAADEGKLEGQFTSNCWVTVTDSTGKSLVNKLMTKGTTLRVTGKPPLDIALGAPKAVNLTYNGQPVSIHAKPGAIHRFKLGQ